MSTRVAAPLAAWFAGVAMAMCLPLAPTVHASENEGDAVTTGSGESYLTTVEEETKGTLSPEDARQVSVLGSRVLTHIHNAQRALDGGDSQAARDELKLAQRLSRIVRELLPVTIVTTEVTDSQGERVYRYEDRVQDDQLPIVEGLINVEVVRPIVEAKEERATLQGFRLADANLVRTAVLLDLGYTERKIDAALTAIEEDRIEEAQDDLLAVSAAGVRFVENEEDHPLVDAQAALRLAERQVRDEKPEAARANLELARINLETYRTLIDEAETKKVSDLLDRISDLEKAVSEPQTADRIREYWNEIASWFTAEPGMAQATP